MFPRITSGHSCIIQQYARDNIPRRINEPVPNFVPCLYIFHVVAAPALSFVHPFADRSPLRMSMARPLCQPSSVHIDRTALESNAHGTTGSNSGSRPYINTMTCSPKSVLYGNYARTCIPGDIQGKTGTPRKRLRGEAYLLACALR